MFKKLSLHFEKKVWTQTGKKAGRIVGKTTAILLTTATMISTAMPQQVLAGWVQDTVNNKTQYKNDETGQLVKSDWILLNNKWYYFGEDGNMYTGLHKITDANGKTDTYFFEEEGENKGVCYMNQWKKINGKWYYFNETCRSVKGWLEKANSNGDNRWYYFDENGEALSGLNVIDGRTYYLGEGGDDVEMRTGWQVIGGEKYFFSPVADKGLDIKEGQMRTGKVIDNDKLYLIEDDGKLVRGSGVRTFHDEEYYVLEDDSVYTNIWWQKIDGEWYYIDDEYYYLWQTSKPDNTKVGIDVSVYQGKIDWKEVKDFGIDFAIIRMGYVGPELDETFEDNINGAIENDIPAGVYFYSRATTLEEIIGEAQFVIDNLDGKKISYPVALDLEDAYKTNWNNMSKEEITTLAKAFCDEIKAAGYTPVLYSGLNWLRNHIDFEMLGDIDIWQARYYFEPSDSIPFTIWQGGSTTLMAGIPDNTVDVNFDYKDYTKYITPRTKAADTYVKTLGIWKSDNVGSWYSYISGGYPESQWETIEGKKYYFDSRGYMVTGWAEIDNNWYYFDDSGVNVTGFKTIGGTDYYFYNDGVMATNWVELNGDWYFAASSGALIKGWAIVGSKWYYFDNNGKMMSGWQKINDKWYYLGQSYDGAMKSGWQQINNRWYYLGEDYDGSMKSGWQFIGNYWYYLGSEDDGAMRTDWQFIDGYWFYFGPGYDGAMKTDWQEIRGKWYFFYNYGNMAYDEYIGEYYVDENGAWVE